MDICGHAMWTKINLCGQTLWTYVLSTLTYRHMWTCIVDKLCGHIVDKSTGHEYWTYVDINVDNVVGMHWTDYIDMHIGHTI